MSRFRSVGVLAAGTAVSQLIAFAVAPLLSRLYSPADFGLFGVFISVAAMAAVIVTLRLDLAVVVPEADEEAMDVVGVGVLIAAAMTALSAALVLVAGDLLGQLLGEPGVVPLLALLPLYLGANGVFQMLNYWSTRTSHFARLSVAEMTRSVSVAGVQVAGGYLGTGAGGLALGQVFGQVVATCMLIVRSAATNRTLFRRRLSVELVRQVFGRFRSFVVFGTPQALVNAINQGLPAFVLTVSFDAGIAGHYVMAQRLLSAPIGLLGRSTRQVLYPRLSRAMSDGDALRVALRSTGLLAVAAAVPVAVVIAAGPAIYRFVLGNEWVLAGEFSRYLVLWLAVAFVNIPSVSLIPLLEMQRWHAAYEVVYLCARFAALLIGGSTGDALTGIILFSLVGVAFNLVLIAVPLVQLGRSGRAKA
jgi:O-antigen/teichoic acid export membrane protein